MKLNDFEKHIDETILDRGYDYYDEGRISEIIKQGDRDYHGVCRIIKQYKKIAGQKNQNKIIQELAYFL